MKKIIGLVLLTAVSATLFISCKKDEGPATILGKWNATKEFYTEYKNGVVINADTTLYGDIEKLSVEFASNGNGKVSFTNENNNLVTEGFTYKTEANNLTIYISGDTSNSTFTVTNKEFIMYSSEENESQGDHYKWEDKTFFTR